MKSVFTRAIGRALLLVPLSTGCGPAPQGTSGAPTVAEWRQATPEVTAAMPAPPPPDGGGCRESGWTVGLPPDGYVPSATAGSNLLGVKLSAGELATSSVQPPVYEVIVEREPGSARALGSPHVFEVVGAAPVPGARPVLAADPVQRSNGVMSFTTAFTSFSGAAPSLSLVTVNLLTGVVVRRTVIPGTAQLTDITATSITMEVPTATLTVEGDKVGILTDGDSPAATHFRAVWTGYLEGAGNGAAPDSIVTF